MKDVPSLVCVACLGAVTKKEELSHVNKLMGAMATGCLAAGPRVERPKRAVSPAIIVPTTLSAVELTLLSRPRVLSLMECAVDI